MSEQDKISADETSAKATTDAEISGTNSSAAKALDTQSALDAPLAHDLLVLGSGKSGMAVVETCLAGARTKTPSDTVPPADTVSPDTTTSSTMSSPTDTISPVANSVTLVDTRPREELPEDVGRLEGLGLRVLCGAPVAELLKDRHFDLGVTSPGISPFSEMYKAASQACDALISEPEFAYRLSPKDWIAVTGTNGKTTTTALVTHLLASSGIDAFACGNIGEPCVSAAAHRALGEMLVAELSSYQLFGIDRFAPRVAVLLNITPDHIDWHRSHEHYVAAKLKMFSNMGAGDVAVLNLDDEGVAAHKSELEAAGLCVMGVSLDGEPAQEGGFVLGGMLSVRHQNVIHGLCAIDELGIKGEHNVSNALHAACVAIAMGADASLVRKGLMSFSAIEHRLEPLSEVGGVAFFNDSKATNVDATLKALTAFRDDPLILLLGGYDKGTDLSRLAEEALSQCKAVVVFGAARTRFAQALKQASERTSPGKEFCLLEAATLQEATHVAYEKASKGDAVLLSPACASFDEFTSFEHRGDMFRSYVDALRGDL